MLVTISGGWIAGEARNELDFKVAALGADAQEVAHLQSLVDDNWSVENVALVNGQLTLDVKAARKVSLADQAVAKAKVDADAAAAKAVADQVAAEAQAEQSAKDVRLQNIAAAAAKAAVTEIEAAENR